MIVVVFALSILGCKSPSDNALLTALSQLRESPESLTVSTGYRSGEIVNLEDVNKRQLCLVLQGLLNSKNNKWKPSWVNYAHDILMQHNGMRINLITNDALLVVNVPVSSDQDAQMARQLTRKELAALRSAIFGNQPMR